MNIWMDVDAALASVSINTVALIDDTDFKTREDGLTYNQAGLDLKWVFTTTAGTTTSTSVTPTTGGDYDWTNLGNGYYGIEIPASGGASINNDTEGFGHFEGYATGVLPWTGPTIGFRAAALNNALIDGGDLLDVSLTQIGGAAQSATDLKDFADTGYNPATHVAKADLHCILEHLLTQTGTQVADAFQTMFDVASPALLASSAMVGTDGAYTGTPATSDANATAVWAEATRVLTSDSGPTAETVASDVWNSLKAAHAVENTFGAYLNSDIQTAIDSGGGPAPSSDAVADAVWNELNSDHVVAGSVGQVLSDVYIDVAGLDGNVMVGTDGAYTGTPPTAVAIASDVWNSLKAAHAVADSFGAYLNSDIQTAIASSGAGAPTASDVAQVVWDSRRSDHVTAGSTGQALSDAYVDVAGLNGDAMVGTDGAYTGTPPTAAAIADATLNELLSDHVTPGSLSKIVSDAAWEVSGLNGEAMVGTDGAYTGTPPTSAAIASDTWNSLQAAHVVANSMGQVVSDVLEEVDGLDGAAMVGTNGAYTGTPASSDAVADAVWDEQTSTHTTSGSAGQALSDVYIDVAGLDGATMVGTDGAYTGTPPTSAAIAAATLDELLSDHVVTGSLSKIVSDAAWEVAGLNGEAMRGTDSAYTGTPPTAAAIASDTWNSLKAAHAIADTFGAYLNSDIQTAIDADGGTAPTASDIAGVVWDSRLSDHVTANSTGQALSDAYIDVAGLDGAVMRGTDSAYTGTPPTAAAIASDTWNSLQTAHVGAGTFGQVASDVLAEVDGLDGEAMRGTNSANTAAPPPASDIAQFVLKQSMSDIEDVAALNSLATIIQASLESNMTTSSDWIIYKTDGTTQLQARQVTSDSSASPITRVQ